MKRKCAFSVAITFGLLINLPAYATETPSDEAAAAPEAASYTSAETVDCTSTCPSGKTMISGTVGHGQANCTCVQSRAREEVEPIRAHDVESPPNTDAGDV